MNYTKTPIPPYQSQIQTIPKHQASDTKLSIQSYRNINPAIPNHYTILKKPLH
jgi:hypothetical protein